MSARDNIIKALAELGHEETWLTQFQTTDLEEMLDKMNLTKEQEKFEKVKHNIEDKILFHRFDTLEELNELLKKEFSIEAETASNSEENISETGCDNALISGINEHWGYVDIYYLIDHSNRLLITEITVSEE